MKVLEMAPVDNSSDYVKNSYSLLNVGNWITLWNNGTCYDQFKMTNSSASQACLSNIKN